MVIYEEAINITRPYEWLIYVSDVTDYNFGWIILLALFMISFVSMLNWGAARAMASAGALTTIIATFFFLLTIIDILALFICIIGTAGTLVLLQIQLKKG